MTKPGIFRQLLQRLRSFGFKQWFLLVLNLVLLLAMAASLIGLKFVSGVSASTSAADRFRGEGEIRFAQIACFLPVGQGKTETDVLTFRQALAGKFVEQSLEAPEGGKLYLDAYSGSGEVSVSGENGSATVTALGVGGEFFYFHPLTLNCGSYISGDDLMDDLVVLDEEMAWRLFGAVDVAGMDLTINGKPFLVGGVVAREEDFATKRAYTGDGGLYMSFSALQRLVEAATINCYEIVLPDPITGYAKNMVAESFPVGKGDVVENSSRYTLGNLLGVIRSFGERSMRVNGVIYPYWENALRLTEDYAAGLLVLAVLFALCPACFLFVFLVRSIRRGYRYVKRAVPEKVERTVEKHREKEYEKKAGGE